MQHSKGYPILNLPSTLHRFLLSRVQAVLSAPMGVVRLMDMLGDKEALRNEALLLFMGLSRSNQTIQQIAAFEGAFERLLTIIRSGFLSMLLTIMLATSVPLKCPLISMPPLLCIHYVLVECPVCLGSCLNSDCIRMVQTTRDTNAAALPYASCPCCF